MVLTFVVPLVTIIFANGAIFVSLRRRCQRGLVHKAAAKSKSKAALMLGLVVSGFVVCWAPSITMTTVRSYRGLHNTPIDVIVGVCLSANLLVLCSSLVNPLIYSFYSSGFKNDLIKLCVSHLMARFQKTRRINVGFCRNQIAVQEAPLEKRSKQQNI